MQTIAIVNEKGGTGKTTTAVNLSAALGQLGQKVLLVDLDGQAASSRWLGVEDDDRFADALWRGGQLEPIPDVIPGVSLAPASGKLDSVSHDLRPTQGGQLRKLLSSQNGFDYIIIDCPPSLGNRLIGNALLAATHAIVPVETSILALDGLKILLTTFEDIRQGFDHEIILAGVLACRYDARTRLSRLILEELNRALPGKVFKTVIRENVRVRECPGSGQSILTYAPKSHSAEDYMSLAREVMGVSDEATSAAGDLEPAAGSALAKEESIATGEMRQQVDAVLRGLEPEEAAAGPEGALAELEETLAKLDEAAPEPEEAAPEPEGAAAELEVTLAKLEEAAPEPEEAAPEPEDAAAELEATLAKLEEAVPEPEEAAAELEPSATQAPPTPDEKDSGWWAGVCLDTKDTGPEAVPEAAGDAQAVPEQLTPAAPLPAMQAQGESDAGPGPVPDDGLTYTDEQDRAAPSPPWDPGGVGAEAGRDETPLAAGSDESTGQVDDAEPTSRVYVIDEGPSIIGRNGTGRALGAVRQARQLDQPWEGRAEPSADEPPAAEPSADEPPADEPSADEPAAVDPPADEPAADELPAVEPPADEPPAVDPPADEPAAVEPPTDELPAVEPPAVEPPADEPAAVEPAASPGAESPEPTETSLAPGEKYPALREMLRGMAPEGDKEASAPNHVSKQSSQGHRWRRLLRKMAGVD